MLELLGEMAEVTVDRSVRDTLGKWAMDACHDDFNIPHPGLVRYVRLNFEFLCSVCITIFLTEYRYSVLLDTLSSSPC